MNYLFAFLIGGGFCLLADICVELLHFSFAKTCSLFVVLGGLVYPFGFYESWIDATKGGTCVPIFSFGYSMTKGAVQALSDLGPIGIFKGGLESTAVGISFAVLLGFLFSLFSKPKG